MAAPTGEVFHIAVTSHQASRAERRPRKCHRTAERAAHARGAEHADRQRRSLIAVLVSGLDGLARKGDVISDTVAEVITQVRGAGRATGMDVRETTHQLATIIPALAEAAPAISRVAASPIVDEGPVEVVGLSGTALSEAYDQPRAAARSGRHPRSAEGDAGEGRPGWSGLPDRTGPRPSAGHSHAEPPASAPVDARPNG